MITRQDLSPGYQCVQSCHAVADFSYQFPESFKRWKLESNSIITLSVKSESELIKLYNKFSLLVPCSKFFEPDINEWTSICLFGESDIRKKLSYLPLTLKGVKDEKIKNKLGYGDES